MQRKIARSMVKRTDQQHLHNKLGTDFPQLRSSHLNVGTPVDYTYIDLYTDAYIFISICVFYSYRTKICHGNLLILNQICLCPPELHLTAGAILFTQ